MMSQIELQAFDRELTLEDMLRGIASNRLESALQALLGDSFRLVARSGSVVAGRSSAPEGALRVAINHDLEPLGWLEATCDAKRIRAAATLLELLCHQGARYHMASDLHIEVVQANYEALQQQYAALEASEARYRRLSEELEARVEAQVRVIETAQRQLYHAEKMASIGQLAAGVAHEINNPIGFIHSNLSTARRYLERFAELAPVARSHADLAPAWKRADLDFVLEDFASLLGESLDGTARVARIVADLKGFSTIDQMGEDTVDVNESIRAMLNVARPQVEPSADVVLELEPLPAIRGQAQGLNQAFLNLLLNAAQSMEARGEIRIRTRATEREVVVEFSDTGCGIAPDIVSRVFDPFFTTRGVGQGVGLGLTVCRDVVSAHGGRIDVDSKPGAGSRFTVILPLGAAA